MGGKRPRWSGGKEHDRSGAGEERYADVQDVRVVKRMERGISVTMLYCVKSGWWGHGLRGDE